MTTTKRVRGFTSAAIGQQLHLSPKTVESYRSRLMAKLGVGDVPALVRPSVQRNTLTASTRRCVCCCRLCDAAAPCSTSAEFCCVTSSRWPTAWLTC